VVAAGGAKLQHGFTQQLFPLLAECAEATLYEVAYVKRGVFTQSRRPCSRRAASLKTRLGNGAVLARAGIARIAF
jgi:hypothetical protein